MSYHPMRFLLDDERHDDGPIFPHKNHYDLNSKIMLTAIISLSVVVLLVIVLHTYARCVLRRQALRRRAVLRQMNSMAHVHSAEPPKTGLEPSVIALLPTFVFRRVEGREGGDGDVEAGSAIECAVCLSVLVEEEMARLLPNCKHTFHAECIDTWLNSHTTCPICRTEAQPRRVPQPEPREGPVATVVSPTAPLLDRVNSGLSCMEGTSGGGAGGAADAQSCGKVMNGSTSRLGSFRRMLSREKSSRRMVQSCGQEDGIEDLERQ